MNTSKEIRSVSGHIARRTEEKESRKVEGYAALFDTMSKDLGGFTERIERGAFAEAIKGSDVLCVLNHDERRGVLARWTRGEGTLTLREDEKGLFYSFDAPNTALGDELLESLSRGDIRESSFAFIVDAEEWDYSDETKPIRTIKKVRALFDVSPVYYPAYDGTEVKKRMAEHRNAEEAKKEQELKEYFEKLKF